MPHRATPARARRATWRSDAGIALPHEDAGKDGAGAAITDTLVWFAAPRRDSARVVGAVIFGGWGRKTKPRGE